MFTKNKSKNSISKVVTVKKSTPRYVWLKDVLLGIINVCFIVGMIFLLQQLPQKAQQVNTLRSEALIVKSSSEIDRQVFDLEANREQIEKLKNVFPDEDTLLKFVDAIEDLKTSGSVVSFTFESEGPVQDRSKNVGIPISIEFKGSWEQIGKDLETIQQLPYVFRPVTFDAEESILENAVLVEYGGFLYVDKSLEKN